MIAISSLAPCLSLLGAVMPSQAPYNPPQPTLLGIHLDPQTRLL